VTCGGEDEDKDSSTEASNRKKPMDILQMFHGRRSDLIEVKEQRMVLGVD
jgi:hypothetical protein